MSLDTKLKEILHSAMLWGNHGVPPKELFIEATTKAIDEITQAFADEGYLTPAERIMWHEEHFKEGHMTGPEWYERFKPLLEEIDLNSKTRYQEIKKAAQKAAGIK